MGFDWKNPASYNVFTNPEITKAYENFGMGIESGARGLGQGNLADKIWGKRGGTVAADNFDKNAALQREFAQNGIKWKMDDARRAGVHPVYALGASGASFSPMYSAGSTDLTNENQWMADVGQGITGAISRSATAEQRQAAQLNLEGMSLDNDLKRAELLKLSMGTPAGVPSESFIDGQGNSGVKVRTVPMQRSASMAGRPDLEPGAKTGTGFYVEKSADGASILVPVPSKDTKESIEDNLFHETRHFWKQNVVPNVTGGNPPPGWKWSVEDQGYRRVDQPAQRWDDAFTDWWRSRKPRKGGYK